MNKLINQSEIWLADLDPVVESEESGMRPVLVVSGKIFNEHLQVVLVCPLTTKLKGVKGNPVLHPNELNGLSSISEVLVFHFRSISKFRLVRKLGITEVGVISQIKKTLNDYINY